MINTATQNHRNRTARRGFVLGMPDLKIIGALRVLSCSGAQQLLRLLGYSPASLTYMQSRLKRLADTGYLERTFLPRPGRAGSAPLLYRLTRKSIPVLREQGLELPYRLRPSEANAHGYLHLLHTLEVNDVLIAATVLARETPGLELARIQHERALQTDPIAVSIAGEQQQVVPDGFLDLRTGQEQYCLLLELDRGTHGQQAWKRKVRGFVGLSNGPYEQRFGTTSLTIMVLTTSGVERLERLVRWTAEELASLDRTALCELFCFTAADPAVIEPARLFFDPLWMSPGSTYRVPLLEPPSTL